MLWIPAMPLISWSSSYWFTNSCDFATVSFSVIRLTKMLKMIIFTASGDAIQCLISIAAWLNAVWAFHWTLVKGKLWVIWYISFVKYSGWNDLKTDTENWSRERVNAHTRMQTSGSLSHVIMRVWAGLNSHRWDLSIAD